MVILITFKKIKYEFAHADVEQCLYYFKKKLSVPVNTISMSFISSIALCSSMGDVQSPSANGMFRVCSGTSGAGAGTPADAGTKIPNSEPDEAITYLSQYVYNKSNACVSGFIPNCDKKSNYVPYQTAFGCCSAAKDWEALGLNVLNDNSSYATTFKAFSTASKPGAQDSYVLNQGIPSELVALEKVWGMSTNIKSVPWAHGGVIPSNVGIFRAKAPNPFQIKYKSKLPNSTLQTWNQFSLLWTRQIGDTYDASLDFYAADAVPLTPGIYAPKPTGPGLPKVCNACVVEGDGNTIFGTGTCATPYFQSCPVYKSITSSDLTDSSMPWANSKNPSTGAYNGYTDPLGRTGGCFVTNSMYGPSTVSVLANLPPVALPLASASPGVDPLYEPDFKWIDGTTGEYVEKTTPGALPGGRGYVFAIWTFGYTENYQTSSVNNTSFNTAVRETPAGGLPSSNVTAEGYDSTQKNSPGNPAFTDVKTTLQRYDGVAQDDGDGDVWVSHNHEIDIELPSNSGQASNNPNALEVLGWNTANMNTWLTDIDEYNPGTKALYQQVQASLPTVDGTTDGQKQYFFAVNPEDDENTYHKYSFTWYVDPEYDPTDPSKKKTDDSYVAFYFDDALIYKSRRFVPRRSGRVVIGLWPAWWGTNHFPMTFNAVYAKIARIDIVPQADIDGNVIVSRVTNAAQVYDQYFPIKGGNTSADTRIRCGFTSDIPRGPIYGGEVVTGQTEHLKGNASFVCPAKSGLSTLNIILICIGCVIAALALSLGLYFGLKKRTQIAATATKGITPLPISAKK